MSGGGVDAKAVDLHRSGPLAGREHETYHGVPPVKQAPFDLPHIPLYFWVGGIAAGSWLAATAEEWAGEDDRDVVRAGRYLTVGSVMAGTVLLIADLGRPERFLNMLRVFRRTSAMSLGSWALASFGGFAGLSALLQAAEDGLLGDRPVLAELSTGGIGRAAQLVGLPAALFVGSYTGVLLSSTAAPTWARRAGILSPLFTASAVANGLAAVDLALEAGGGARPGTDRRLSRAQVAALGAEAALEVVNTRAAGELPSSDSEGAKSKALRWAAMAGIALPLAAHLYEGWRERGPSPRRGVRPRGRRSPLRMAAAAAGLAGGLALRWLAVDEGQRSAATPEDTWAHARERGDRGERQERRERHEPEA